MLERRARFWTNTVIDPLSNESFVKFTNLAGVDIGDLRT